MPNTHKYTLHASIIASEQDKLLQGKQTGVIIIHADQVIYAFHHYLNNHGLAVSWGNSLLLADFFTSHSLPKIQQLQRMSGINEKELQQFTLHKALRMQVHATKNDGYLLLYPQYIWQQNNWLADSLYQLLNDSVSQELIEGVNIGYLLADKDENVLACNQSLLDSLDATRSQVIGKNLHEFADEQSYDKLRKFTQERIKGRKSNYEIALQSPQGEPVYFYVSAIPWHGANGDYLASMAFMADISHVRQLEKAVMHNQQQLQFLLERSDIAVMQFNAQKQLQQANRTAELRFIVDPHKTYGKPLHLIFTPNYTKTLEQQLKPVLSSGETRSFQEVFPLEEGKMHYNSHLFPLYNNEEQIVGAQLISYDTTPIWNLLDDLDEQASAIASQNKQLEFLFRLSSEVLQDVNQIEAVFNRTLKIARHLRDSLGIKQLVISYKNQQFVLDQAQATQTKYQLPLKAFGKAVAWLHYMPEKAGKEEQIKLQEVFELTANFLGQVLERIISMNHLQESEQRLKVITNSIPDGLVVINARHELVFWNQPIATLFQLQVGQHYVIDSFLQEQEKKSVIQQIDDRLASKKVQSVRPLEITIHSQNGILPVELMLSGFQISEERLVVGVLRDISNRKKMEADKKQLEQQLLQAQKMESIGTLAGGIAHDFNNILTPIIGYSDMALEFLPDDHVVREDIQHILTGANRAKELVKQLLTFSRHFEEDKKMVYPHLLIGEVLAFLRASIPASVEIKKDIRSKEGRVLVPPIQLHQVLMNLTTNAYQAIDKEYGEIIIGLDVVHPDQAAQRRLNIKDTNYVLLTVQDNGKGMTDSVKDRIFEPFFTTKDLEEGTGLGLAAAHGIITGNEGAIEVDTTIGKGSIFRIYLPCADEEQEKQMLDQEASWGQHGHILVVDDEEEITRMVTQLLERHNYQVRAFNNSQNALEHFATHFRSYDMIITDQTMPHIKGLQLVKEAKALAPDIQVVMMSGYSQELDTSSLEEAGVAAFLEKPINSNQLKRILQQLLGG